MDAYRPLLIAGLVVTEVAIWQWRMVIAHRGSRVSAMLLGIVGAVLQITAITQVVADVSDPAGVIAYAVGVVARRVGYDAEEAFSRAFKRANGESPSVWRAAYLLR